MSGVDRAPAEDAPHLKFARPRNIDEARPIAERAEEGSQRLRIGAAPRGGAVSMVRRNAG
ncbi:MULTISPECIES: hypothetical protein [Ralstonia solanacearum species complex]|uniref:hypothetical protein n=1 Tax=Ralstonia solanacearum species complex TaxID=3116862 RepID=UPI00031C5AB7|nr:MULTISPECIES: hypothetical protein [Ralstonia solanacearum species complex]